ncbi:hypothetical protein, partial [Pseudomonas gingeri]|uniref:hypothetical protein n=1 Tax=Pseudomonas gingeri TaxID=117681 RepID=UPI001C433DAD
TKHQKRLLERVAFFVSAEKAVQHMALEQNEPSTETGVNACTGYAEFATNFLYNSPGAWVAARRRDALIFVIILSIGIGNLAGYPHPVAHNPRGD